MRSKCIPIDEYLKFQDPEGHKQGGSPGKTKHHTTYSFGILSRKENSRISVI